MTNELPYCPRQIICFLPQIAVTVKRLRVSDLLFATLRCKKVLYVMHVNFASYSVVSLWKMEIPSLCAASLSVVVVCAVNKQRGSVMEHTDLSI